MMKSTSQLQLSGARILVITGDDWFDSFHANTLIERAWHGPVDYVPGATRERLLEAVCAGYPIVHLLANFGADHIVLQDGPISVVQFRELLKLASGRTRLLVLAGCSSYAIGKEVEETGIACSVVATANLEVRLAESFFLSIYTHLDRGSTPDESFSRAYMETVFRFGPEGRVPLYFTNYGQRAREVAVMDEQSPVTVLFLASNPTTTSGLDLEEELRAVENELRSTKLRDRIELVARHAVRPDDLVRYLRSEKPRILHFSGHGSPDGLILRNDIGSHQTVSGASLRRLLEGRGVELVVLNSCFSADQANEIVKSVPVVVGTSAEVDDEAARRFACAFYRCIGDGLSIRDAFRDGGDAVELHGLIDVFQTLGELDRTLVR